ncbi:MAG: hypothetical protein IKN22_06910, partial [Bacteroidaceae bacterium]|nr:hypothetical protein [Bacteroidaceae bacterium]
KEAIYTQNPGTDIKYRELRTPAQISAQSKQAASPPSEALPSKDGAPAPDAQTGASPKADAQTGASPKADAQTGASPKAK